MGFETGLFWGRKGVLRGLLEGTPSNPTPNIPPEVEKGSGGGE